MMADGDDIDDDQEWEIRPLGIIVLVTQNHTLAEEVNRRLESFMRKHNQVIEVRKDGLYFRNAEVTKVEVTTRPRLD